MPKKKPGKKKYRYPAPSPYRKMGWTPHEGDRTLSEPEDDDKNREYRLSGMSSGVRKNKPVQDVPPKDRFLPYRAPKDMHQHRDTSFPLAPEPPVEVQRDPKKRKQWDEYWKGVQAWWGNVLRDEQRRR